MTQTNQPPSTNHQPPTMDLTIHQAIYQAHIRTEAPQDPNTTEDHPIRRPSSQPSTHMHCWKSPPPPPRMMIILGVLCMDPSPGHSTTNLSLTRMQEQSKIQSPPICTLASAPRKRSQQPSRDKSADKTTTSPSTYIQHMTWSNKPNPVIQPVTKSSQQPMMNPPMPQASDRPAKHRCTATSQYP